METLQRVHRLTQGGPLPHGPLRGMAQRRPRQARSTLSSCRLALSDTVALDVVGDLYDWCTLVKPSGHEPLFSWDKGTKFPNKTACNLAIKRAAVTVGLSPKGMSSHSLRIGGVSTMYAADMNGFEMMQRGDWKTLTFLIYLRTSVAACDKALLNLVNPKFYTIDDARRISRDASS